MNQSILFVCLGNICRSPTAEGVFRKLSELHLADNNLTIDSAGTSAYHVGEAPDSRSIAAAAARGYDLSQIRARQFVAKDLEKFDLVLAMDQQNLQAIKTAGNHLDEVTLNQKARLFLEFSQSSKTDQVPDPYYGGATGFNQVIDLIEDASLGLIDWIKRHA